MADKLQKVTTLKKDLPPLSGVYNSYIVRYRIVSEDKNRFSHWSPLHYVVTQNVTKFTAPDGVKTSGIYIVQPVTNNTMTVVWTPPSNFVNEYDVYISKDDGDTWTYVSTTSGNSYSYTSNQGTTVSMAVTVPTYPKEKFENATLFVATATV